MNKTILVILILILCYIFTYWFVKYRVLEPGGFFKPFFRRPNFKVLYKNILEELGL